MSKLNLVEAYKEEILRFTDRYDSIELDNKSEYELKVLLDNIVLGKVR